MSNCALWITSWASPMNASNSSTLLGEQRLVGQELVAEAVHVLRARRHDHFGIEVGVEGPAGGHRVDQLDAAHFDDAMAGQRIEAGGFGVEDDFAHEALVAYLRRACARRAVNFSRHGLAGQNRPRRRLELGHRLGQRGARRRQPQAGRDDDVGLAALHGVRHLLAQDAVELLRRHAGPRHHPMALQEGGRAHHQRGVDPAIAQPLEQQRDVEHDQLLAALRGPLQEGALPLADQRMHDGFELAQRLPCCRTRARPAPGGRARRPSPRRETPPRSPAAPRRPAPAAHGRRHRRRTRARPSAAASWPRSTCPCRSSRSGRRSSSNAERPSAAQGTRMVCPVVLRPSRSIWAWAASASG